MFTGGLSIPPRTPVSLLDTILTAQTRPPSGLPGLGDLSALAELLNIPKTRKLFVSYHHDNDQWYYDQLEALCGGCDFLTDRSVDRLIGISDDVEYQERRIREEYISGTSATIVLCGRETPWRKFIDWEIFATLYKDHGLVGVLLPYAQQNASGQYIVPDRLHDNIVSGFAVWKTWSELNTSANPAATLRQWTEAAAAKDRTLIRNWRDKRARNG
jgi:hypothetical protein